MIKRMVSLITISPYLFINNPCVSMIGYEII
jgi:hypothetical protein